MLINYMRSAATLCSISLLTLSRVRLAELIVLYQSADHAIPAADDKCDG